MAQGTLVVFSDFMTAVMEGNINLETATLKCAFVSDSQATWTKATADPRWGAGGSTNLSTNEVSGTNYTAGGNSCANPVASETGDVFTYDADDPATWSQHASGPTNIKTAVLYIDDANDYAIGFIDMTTDSGTTAISLADGDITVSFGASGIFTVTN